MTAAPQYSEDRNARVGKNKRGTIMFWHPCRTCGLVNAPFGFNVNIAKGHPGEWYCASDIPPEYRKTASTRTSNEQV